MRHVWIWGVTQQLLCSKSHDSWITSSKNYAISLNFKCSRAKTAWKSWDLLHRSCWVTPQIHMWHTSPRMEYLYVRGDAYINERMIEAFNLKEIKKSEGIFWNVKLRYCEKVTKLEKISHLFWQKKLFLLSSVKTSGRFFQIFVAFSWRQKFKELSTLKFSLPHRVKII